MSQITITKIGTASPLGKIKEVAISALHDEISSSVAPQRHPRLATAVRTSSGDLEITVWESTDTGPISVDTISALDVSEISVAGLSSSRLVTAFRDGSGDLRLIVWEIANGTLVRKAHNIAGGTPGQIAVVRLTSTRMLTAFRTETGNLGLIVWDYSNGVLTRKGSKSAGGVYLIELTSLTSSRVVTAFSNATNHLAMIVWDIDDKGEITRKGSVTSGNLVKAIAVNSLSDTQIATSIINVSDNYNLRVDVWDVNAKGEVHHKADASGGSTGLVAGGDTRTGVFPTAIRDADGQLKLIAWDVTTWITRAGDMRASEEIIGLGATTLLPGSQSMLFATASWKENGELGVTTWQISPYDAKKQSPIPLVTSQAAPVANSEAMPVYTGKFSSARVVKKFHVEDGHKSVVDVMMEIPWDTNPAAQVTLRIGQPDSTGTPQPTTYRVLQIHMHRHSEHTIGGRVSPLEMHCVLGDPGADNAGPKAVLGFLIKEGTENAGLSFYFDNLGQEDLTTVEFATPQDLNDLLPQDKTYFSYHGSLTSPSLDNTPLNATPILWYVLENEISVSPGQFAKYEQAVEEHYRILQSNDSKVWLIKP
jgi:hypothetical protein